MQFKFRLIILRFSIPKLHMPMLILDAILHQFRYVFFSKLSQQAQIVLSIYLGFIILSPLFKSQ